jgi:hypothetical protein
MDSKVSELVEMYGDIELSKLGMDNTGYSHIKMCPNGKHKGEMIVTAYKSRNTIDKLSEMTLVDYIREHGSPTRYSFENGMHIIYFED